MTKFLMKLIKLFAFTKIFLTPNLLIKKVVVYFSKANALTCSIAFCV